MEDVNVVNRFFFGSISAVVAFFAAPAAAEGAILGPDAAACRSNASGPAVLVDVVGLKDRVGNVRIQVYDDNKDSFLAKGARLSRIEAPVPAAGTPRVCVPLPKPGRYALYVLHDRAGDGKVSFSNDGVGFSRNPKLRLAKPAAGEVIASFGAGVSQTSVVMNYRKGLLGVGPVSEK
jgi:uncharacterized protein (DUF2141 family)